MAVKSRTKEPGRTREDIKSQPDFKAGKAATANRGSSHSSRPRATAEEVKANRGGSHSSRPANMNNKFIRGGENRANSYLARNADGTNKDIAGRQKFASRADDTGRAEMREKIAAARAAAKTGKTRKK